MPVNETTKEEQQYAESTLLHQKNNQAQDIICLRPAV